MKLTNKKKIVINTKKIEEKKNSEQKSQNDEFSSQIKTLRLMDNKMQLNDPQKIEDVKNSF